MERERSASSRQSERDGSLTHHSERGSQYVFIRYSERLAEAGIKLSVGSKGDSDDNALAETVNRLYKAEGIHRRPWPTRKSVELVTLQWVSWSKHHRLFEPIRCIPPAKAEPNYHRYLASRPPWYSSDFDQPVFTKSGRFSESIVQYLGVEETKTPLGWASKRL
jgi:transposase InsO family protein